MKHILSFYITKGKSVYCFIHELRNTIIDATLIEHNKNDFDTLFNLIKDYPNLIVVMESTPIYHLPEKLILDLKLLIIFIIKMMNILCIIHLFSVLVFSRRTNQIKEYI